MPLAPARKEYPFLSEHDLLRREIRRGSVPLRDSDPGLDPLEDAYLLQSELEDRIAALALGPLDRAILDFRLEGRTVREIAALTGLTRFKVSKAMKHLRLAYRRSRAPAASLPHAGWQDVYRGETRRQESVVRSQ